MGEVRLWLSGFVPHFLRRAMGQRVFDDRSSNLCIRSLGAFSVAYRGGTSDEAVLEESFEKDLLFARLPEYHPSPNDTIVDIGAHIGTFALLAASRVPQGRVYAIESCEETFNFLTVNVALNHATNIFTSRLAVIG